MTIHTTEIQKPTEFENERLVATYSGGMPSRIEVGRKIMEPMEPALQAALAALPPPSPQDYKEARERMVQDFARGLEQTPNGLLPRAIHFSTDLMPDGEMEYTTSTPPDIVFEILGMQLSTPRETLDEKTAIPEFIGATERSKIAAFIQKYGRFLNHPEDTADRFVVDFFKFSQERDHFHKLFGLWSAVKRSRSADDPDERHVAAVKSHEIASEMNLPFADDPAFALSIQLSERLHRRSNLLIEAASDRLGTMLYCHDVLTGLYGLLFQMAVYGGSWAICPQCGDIFEVTRNDRETCSKRCRVNRKQARRRTRLKNGNGNHR